MREPVNELKAALVAYLRADATLMGMLAGAQGVFEDGNQREEALPLVTYVRAGGHSEHTLEGRAASVTLIRVKAIAGGTSGSKTAGLAAARIDELLDSRSFAIAAPFQVAEVRFVAPVDYPEQDGGELYMHRGGVYEIWVTAAG